ncbi:MAG: hypothetical protein DI582_03250 [Azospirillum brasilense]|nr:MAG: hypothetical protein DI582_03250 [Azospirillum brasilense]
MAVASEEQGAIIALMHGKYEQLLRIEAEWGIRLSEGDMRPRIEHFHDAVRALTSGTADIYAKNSRLSVENLAYDLSVLRSIPDRPTGYINRTTEKSFSTALVRQNEAGAGFNKMPPQGVRAEITALYRDYTVFFAALFAPVADRNFKSRVDAVDASVADVGLVEQILSQLIAGKMSNAQAMAEMNHVERDDLRERIQAMLARKVLSAREKQEALAMLAQIERGLDSEKKRVEQSHLTYATGQLAVYEDAKDTVKKLAAQGLNLAGKFLENAMQQAGRGQGRGQGRN